MRVKKLSGSCILLHKSEHLVGPKSYEKEDGTMNNQIFDCNRFILLFLLFLERIGTENESKDLQGKEEVEEGRVIVSGLLRSLLLSHI